MPKTKDRTLTFRVDEKRYQELISMSEDLDTTISKICRGALDDAISEWKRRKGFSKHPSHS